MGAKRRKCSWDIEQGLKVAEDPSFIEGQTEEKAQANEEVEEIVQRKDVD